MLNASHFRQLHRWRIGCLACWCVITMSLFVGNTAAADPNIVLILADDLGYGDPQCYNADSKCPTPNIDRLAAEGRMFTDAHTAGSVCVPSRYGLLTGRYPFRTQLNPNRRAVIEDGRETVPTMLKREGYDCAMVGKWHLGFDGGPDYDYAQDLIGGPLDRGFKRFFGMPHSLDITPYYYISGRRATAPPTGHIEASASAGWSPIQGAFWRAGGIASDFKHDEVLDRFADHAVKYLADRVHQSDQPFFLYLALTAPHTPWLPAERFQGIGEAGLYSAFVAHVDDVVGRVLNALDEHGHTEETLVIFTSDNGPVWYEDDARRFGHSSTGPLRGMKGDAWEGGHRVPFIVRWPDHVPAGTTSPQVLGFVDMLATLAALVESELPEGAGPDSANVLPVFLGDAGYRPLRTSIVLHHSGSVIRQGPWKLINHLGSGGFSQPRRVQPEPGGPRGQLYNLEQDPGETTNLWSDHPELVAGLLADLERIRSGP